MNPADLLHTCRKLGVSFQPRGDGLAVRPANRATPELLLQLRAHKDALLLLLEAEAALLPQDCAPWIHTARQVMAGEFAGGDRSLLDALHIGLRNIAHPVCRQARARLETMLGRNRKEARR